MGGLHALQVFRIRKSIVCYLWVTGNCGLVPVKGYIEGMALCSAGLTCHQLWLPPRCLLFCETTMATYGPGQRICDLHSDRWERAVEGRWANRRWANLCRQRESHLVRSRRRWLVPHEGRPSSGASVVFAS